MIDNHEPAIGGLAAGRRCRGRPQVRSDEETRRVIVDAAASEFETKGYAGACIADVATRAGVSTRTLYRLVPTKAELFTDVVSERIDRVVLELEHDMGERPDPLVEMERMLFAFGALTLSPGTIAINRLVLGECGAFPEIAASFYEKAIRRTSEAMAHALRRLCDLGLIDLDDPREAAEMLRGMMILEPQRAAMLGQKPPPDEAAIQARAKRCARLFLKGCAPRGGA